MGRGELIRRSLEWSLCLLLVPAVLASIEFLITGLTFGFNLWRPDRLFATAVWSGVVALPFAVAWALNWSFKARSLAVTAPVTVVAWSFVAFALWDLYVSRWGW